MTETTKKKYRPHLYRCSNCGGQLTEEQIALALADAAFGTDAEVQDALGLHCPDYSDTDGCQGQTTGTPYWYAR